ncbi:unnamed protein product [Somion occarium]|uniref:FAD-binding PCMH-type domain-containing protein n=1 Tax=Somion occarium TaxID=3059160 RepID=A0ABP1DWX7_9APHY
MSSTNDKILHSVLSGDIEVDTARADDALTSDKLKQDIIRLFQDDHHNLPFVKLLAVIDDPDVDYTNPKVQNIFNDIHRLDEKPVKLPTKKFHVHPFYDLLGDEDIIIPDADLDEDEAKTDHIVAHGLFAGLHRIKVKVEALEEKVASVSDATVSQVDENEFSNWGKNVNFDAGSTLIVRSVAGVCKVVQWAAAQDRKVRAAGFRHSWSDIYGGPGDVIIMFLPINTLTQLPYEDPPADWKTELSGIEIVPSVAGRAAPEGRAFCKIMAGTTNDQLRQWCFGNKTWCLDLNVIMVEITFGGSNAPICHGAGFKTDTLSDLVVEVTYVDAKGELQTVNDPTELRAASGCFGLLGIVVSLTLELGTMGVTDMSPVKIPMPLAIPPPKDYPIPGEVQKLIEKLGITEEQLDHARIDFVNRCEGDFYLEWFWFPYQDNCWVNTWSRRPITPDELNLEAYPGDSWLDGVKSQQIQATLAEALVNYTPFRWLSGRHQAFLLGGASLFALPNVTEEKDIIKTFVSEALHFRRGIQNFRCWDTEWEIPLPTIKGQRDYELVQRAWWDGISAMYSRKDAPVRVALEMRLTGGSNVLLAPQRGNAGTVSIEVLTTLITPKDDWQTFMQQIADKWTSYDLKDENGNTLYPRPHWAKQWGGLQIHGKPIERYFREDAYKDAFSEFRKTFGNIVTSRGSSVDETLKMFGTVTMERLIFN